MIDVIFFDFDGVIIDSMLVRDYGFRKIFNKFPGEKVEQLIAYHRYNAGLSRFVKIRYFFNDILQSDITEKEVYAFANEFSFIMRAELANKKYLIGEAVDFIKRNEDKTMHIVSGSEENELKYLCRHLGIDNYFRSVEGSPAHKNDLVKMRLEKENYNRKNCIFIGDSINDYEAAVENGIIFYGYNNLALKDKGLYIDTFKDFNL